MCKNRTEMRKAERDVARFVMGPLDSPWHIMEPGNVWTSCGIKRPKYSSIQFAVSGGEPTCNKCNAQPNKSGNQTSIRMTLGQYKSAVDEARSGHVKELDDLAIKFALSSNPYKKDDIITDRIGSARIIKIHSVQVMNGRPTCIYKCETLNKDLSVKKGSSIRYIYQSNIKSK